MRSPEMQGGRYNRNHFMLTLSNAAMHVKKSAPVRCKEGTSGEHWGKEARNGGQARTQGGKARAVAVRLVSDFWRTAGFVPVFCDCGRSRSKQAHRGMGGHPLPIEAKGELP